MNDCDTFSDPVRKLASKHLPSACYILATVISLITVLAAITLFRWSRFSLLKLQLRRSISALT